MAKRNFIIFSMEDIIYYIQMFLNPKFSMSLTMHTLFYILNVQQSIGIWHLKAFCQGYQKGSTNEMSFYHTQQRKNCQILPFMSNKKDLFLCSIYNLNQKRPNQYWATQEV